MAVRDEHRQPAGDRAMQISSMHVIPLPDRLPSGNYHVQVVAGPFRTNCLRKDVFTIKKMLKELAESAKLCPHCFQPVE